MKNKDLISALQQHDPEMEVAIFDWRKNIISDLGEPSAGGIYPEIKLEKIEAEEDDRIPAQDRNAASWIALAFTNEDLDDAFAEPKCRACGCTDEDCRQCIQKTGQPCYWVEEDLCSACVPRIITL